MINYQYKLCNTPEEKKNSTPRRKPEIALRMIVSDKLGGDLEGKFRALNLRTSYNPLLEF